LYGQPSLGSRMYTRPHSPSGPEWVYNMKDVELVLEQSLIRPRATLSVNGFL
jgi:hypothetical protein